jgi:hypothetical protein
MRYIATERSDEEKKEIYDKWKSLINMSKKELVDWGEDPDHLEASLNREEAKDNGKIQSGYDSFHRIKRRKDKPFEEWTAQDFDNASQENGFNGRMLGGKPGKPVGSTGMSKWEISLRNWGHDPSKPNSPSNSKWKSWKKQNEEEIKMSLAKKKKASRNLVSDLYKMSFKVKGGENLRLACLSYLKNKTASAMAITPDMVESLPEEEQSQFKFDVLVAYLNDIKNKVSSSIGNSGYIIKTYLDETGLFNGKNLLSQKIQKPVNALELKVTKKLQTFKNPSSLLKFMGDLIAASTPEEVSKVMGVSLEEVQKEIAGKKLLEKGLQKAQDIMVGVYSLETLKYFAVSVSLSVLKVLVLQVLLFGTTVTGAIMHLVPFLVVILIMAILTDAKTTANLLKKFSIATTVIPAVLITRFANFVKDKYPVVKQYFSSLWDKTKNLFGVKQEAMKLASTNPVFYRMLEDRLNEFKPSY